MHGEKGERLLPISHHRNIMQNLKAPEMETTKGITVQWREEP
jgi:hypothetical protein